MGLSNFSKLAKYLLLLINFLFWIAGFTALALFIWVLTDPSMLITMTQERNHFYIGLYVFLIVGLLILVVAILGCCGSIKESKCMLIGFFCCLLVVLVAQVSAGAWAFHNRDKLDLMIRSSVKNTIQHEYSVIASKTRAFDTFQSHFECCGANGPNDWISSEYNNHETTKTISLEISSPNAVYSIPESCCNAAASLDHCNQARVLPLASKIPGETIHMHGCTDKLVAAFEENVSTLFNIALSILLIEVVGMILSMILCNAIARRAYK